MKVCLFRTSGEEIPLRYVNGLEKQVGIYMDGHMIYDDGRAKYHGDIEESKLLDFIFSLNSLCCCEVIVDKTEEDGDELVRLEVYDDYRE